MATQVFTLDLGVVIAAHVIGAVKNFDPYCGGDTQIGIATDWVPDEPSGIASASLWTRNAIKELEEIVTQVEVETQKTRFNTWKKLADQRTEEVRKGFEVWLSSVTSSSSSASSSTSSSSSSGKK